MVSDLTRPRGIVSLIYEVTGGAPLREWKARLQQCRDIEERRKEFVTSEGGWNYHGDDLYAFNDRAMRILGIAVKGDPKPGWIRDTAMPANFYKPDVHEERGRELVRILRELEIPAPTDFFESCGARLVISGRAHMHPWAGKLDGKIFVFVPAHEGDLHRTDAEGLRPVMREEYFSLAAEVERRAKKKKAKGA